MDAVTNARRTRLDIAINGQIVSSDFMSYVLDFSFTDNAAGQSDELNLSLQAIPKLWSGIKKGMQLSAVINLYDWLRQGEDLSLNCGAFVIDELDLSGPPDKIQIKAVSASLSNNLRSESNTKAWENFNLKDLAQEIATKHGLELIYEAENYYFSRKDQRSESDLNFVNKLFKDNGINSKVHDGKLVLFDAKAYDAKESIFSIPKQGSLFSPSSYSFKSKSTDTAYDNSTLSYEDLDSGELIQISSGETSSKTLKIDERVESKAEAMRLSDSQMREKNKSEVEASLEIMGNPNFLASRNVSLVGFADFDGKYFIEKATHKVSASYSCSLELRKSLSY